MKVSLALIAVVFGVVSTAAASPVTPDMPIIRRHPPAPPAAPGKPGPPAPPAPGVKVASIGKCPQDCWNEGAASAGCDPNADDKCLCGPFFDDVVSCTSAVCSSADNLATLDFLEGACN